MKHFTLILTTLVLTTSCLSQDVISEIDLKPIPSDRYKSSGTFIRPRSYREFRWRATALQTTGVAIGPESLFAVKGSILGRYAYSKVNYHFKREIPVFGVYGGLEFSMFGLFAIWGSAGLNAGISIGPVTLDGSLTFWGIAAENKHLGTTMYTPKVGLQLLDYVWLKAGYSFFLRGENLFPNWMKIGGRSMNFELSAVVPL